ncbi:phosphopantetheine-binding protein [Streptomyces sp. NPDC050704]|uniref:phosphopantetheine-binding protein n=1 Tax=Streptomyces sp. NPDC050704 TaxID=3157219 RepID=UPI003433E1FB
MPNRDDVSRLIGAYISEQFLDGDEDSGLKPDSPLLEWGVLNSMNTSLLLAYIRNELGVTVPSTSITGRHFRDLNSITDMVYGLSRERA